MEESQFHHKAKKKISSCQDRHSETAMSIFQFSHAKNILRQLHSWQAIWTISCTLLLPTSQHQNGQTKREKSPLIFSGLWYLYAFPLVHVCKLLTAHSAWIGELSRGKTNLLTKLRDYWLANHRVMTIVRNDAIFRWKNINSNCRNVID